LVLSPLPPRFARASFSFVFLIFIGFFIDLFFVARSSAIQPFHTTEVL
jgi:hypothetical protein